MIEHRMKIIVLALMASLFMQFSCGGSDHRSTVRREFNLHGPRGNQQSHLLVKDLQPCDKKISEDIQNIINEFRKKKMKNNDAVNNLCEDFLNDHGERECQSNIAGKGPKAVGMPFLRELSVCND